MVRRTFEPPIVALSAAEGDQKRQESSRYRSRNCGVARAVAVVVPIPVHKEHTHASRQQRTQRKLQIGPYVQVSTRGETNGSDPLSEGPTGKPLAELGAYEKQHSA